MSDRVFLDTNVLVYLYTATEPEKRVLAIQACSGPDTWISTQVIHELANTLYRKFSQDWPAIRRVMAELRLNFQVHTVDADTAERATLLAEHTGYSYYDSLILASALETRCNMVYSEDFQSGHKLPGLTIRNPFKEQV